MCVPAKDKDSLAGIEGAAWDKEERVWRFDANRLAGPCYERVRPYVPLMYRPDRPPPHVRPIMIPQTSWGMNLRAVLTKPDWDRIRKSTYAAAGYRCRICGEIGTQWPVEADELWAFDDKAGVQRLVNVIAMCPPCHSVHHFGKTTVSGKTEIAIAQMIKVNGWTRAQAVTAGETGFEEWHRRSERKWVIDYSWAQRKFSVSPVRNADALANEVNRQIVADAQAQADAADILRHVLDGD